MPQQPRPASPIWSAEAARALPVVLLILTLTVEAQHLPVSKILTLVAHPLSGLPPAQPGPQAPAPRLRALVAEPFLLLRAGPSWRATLALVVPSSRVLQLVHLVLQSSFLAPSLPAANLGPLASKRPPASSPPGLVLAQVPNRLTTSPPRREGREALAHRRREAEEVGLPTRPMGAAAVRDPAWHSVHS